VFKSLFLLLFLLISIGTRANVITEAPHAEATTHGDTAMTLDQAIANLIAEQNALDAPCTTMNAARAALKRSSSQKNLTALNEAIKAFEAQIDKIDEARATCDRIEAAANIKARADRHATMAAAEAHAQPSLF
jgi:uncharacterized protein YukE